MLCNKPTAFSASRARANPLSRRVCVARASTISTIEKLQADAQARVQAMIAKEEQDSATRPTVRITLKNSRVALGESWKLRGDIPEFGRSIEAAPYLSTQDGDNWVYEGRVRHGSHSVQAVLRRLDMSYYTGGPSGVLEIPSNLGPEDVVELELN